MRTHLTSLQAFRRPSLPVSPKSLLPCLTSRRTSPSRHRVRSSRRVRVRDQAAQPLQRHARALKGSRSVSSSARNGFLAVAESHVSATTPHDQSAPNTFTGGRASPTEVWPAGLLTSEPFTSKHEGSSSPRQPDRRPTATSDYNHLGSPPESSWCARSLFVRRSSGPCSIEGLVQLTST